MAPKLAPKFKVMQGFESQNKIYSQLHMQMKSLFGCGTEVALCEKMVRNYGVH